jgi:hypothetical protein
MSDNGLEGFIRQHRQEFEERGPGGHVWRELEQELKGRRQSRVIHLLKRHWLKAAVLIVLVVNSVMLVQFLRFKKQQQDLGAIAPELQEAKLYYTSQIEEKLSVIRQYPQETLGLDSSARKELELRNDTYQLLEKELKENPGNERIRAAMIRYYQLKVDLLDKILEELQNKQPVSKKLNEYEREI